MTMQTHLKTSKLLCKRHNLGIFCSEIPLQSFPGQERVYYSDKHAATISYKFPGSCNNKGEIIMNQHDKYE